MAEDLPRGPAAEGADSAEGGNGTGRAGVLYRSAQIEDIREDRTFRFIASTNSVDRYEDIIEQNWDLEEFWRNPVLLWAHNHWDPPIGSVKSFETNDARTESVAIAQLLPEGEDEFVDQIGRLLKARFLRAVSVGFLPLSRIDRKDAKGRWIGYRYLKSKLIELSVVSVPANPDAVQLARSLNLGPQMMRAIFADAAPAVQGPTAPRRRQAELELLRLKGR